MRGFGPYPRQPGGARNAARQIEPKQQKQDHRQLSRRAEEGTGHGTNGMPKMNITCVPQPENAPQVAANSVRLLKREGDHFDDCDFIWTTRHGDWVGS